MIIRTKILFFASNPENTNKLALDEEYRSIGKKIQEGNYRDFLDFEPRLAVRPTDLLDELNWQKPVIVHFSGHGTGEEGLVLKDESGKPTLVSTDDLKALFSTVKGKIRLVVLNACLSIVQAKVISEIIECVVGMDKSIGDEAAITFAEYFYSGIANGNSVKDAFEQGKLSLKLLNIPEEKTPVLLNRSDVDPATVYLIPKSKTLTNGNNLIHKLKAIIKKIPKIIRIILMLIVSAGIIILLYKYVKDLTKKSVKDIDGNIYNTITIGNQIWMAENLKTTKFNDGKEIPLVMDSTKWRDLNTQGYCWYDNDDTVNKNTYGALYNWYTLKTGKLCPIDWHIPSMQDWKTLINYIGGKRVAGSKLKGTNNSLWRYSSYSNIITTRENGFNALPAGYRNSNGGFEHIGYFGFWWSTDEEPFKDKEPSKYAYYLYLGFDTDTVSTYAVLKSHGISVRCLREY